VGAGGEVTDGRPPRLRRSGKSTDRKATTNSRQDVLSEFICKANGDVAFIRGNIGPGRNLPKPTDGADVLGDLAFRRTAQQGSCRIENVLVSGGLPRPSVLF
jgi:hypothetical protein